MTDEQKKARRAILARRATFVAAALAGVACGKESTRPEACLSIYVPPEDAGTQPTNVSPTATPVPGPSTTPPAPTESTPPTPDGPPPMVCLSVLPDPPKDAGTPQPVPGPCLSAPAPNPKPPHPHPKPQACLKIAPPHK